MYYNSKTKQLQSAEPWGKTYLTDEMKAQRYADWQEVADDFVPPATVSEKKAQCLKIAETYQPQFDKLASSFVTAIMTGNETLQASNKAQYVSLKQELTAKIGGVVNG